jgi:hypothetical protein
MKKEKEEDGPPPPHCEACRQIDEGCELDKRNPQDCKLCANNGYIGNVASGPVSPCPACPRGFRLKLWIAHEKREGHWIPEERAA